MPVLLIACGAGAVFSVLALGLLVFALVTTLRARLAPEITEPPSFTTVNELEIETAEPPFLEATSTPEPTPTPIPEVEFVQIANTGGTGAFIRREPRAGAPGIVAHRDGTPLRIVGPDEVVAGRVWRHVEDRNGNRGWTPREYLIPTQQRF